MPWRGLLFAVPVVLSVLAFATVSNETARAYRLQPWRWPGGTIPYYNAAIDQKWAVKQAVEAWNTSGARVRFVAVPRSQARLLIRHDERNCRSHSRLGHAQISARSVPGARATPQRAIVLVLPRDERSLSCNHFTSALVLAHELGHVLGLGHEDRRCAAMNWSATYLGGSSCPRVTVTRWRCRLLEADDVRGAIALYGGKTAPIRQPATCPLYEPIQPPRGFQASFSAEQVGIELAFVRPKPATLPPFLRRANQTRTGGYAFTRAAQTCPSQADLTRARRLPWSVAIGEQTRIYDAVPTPGRYCYAVWALDVFGIPSARAATEWVTIPALSG